MWDFVFFHQDGKTALYWAVEKGNVTMVRDILQCNPDTESCTKVRHRQCHEYNVIFVFFS